MYLIPHWVNVNVLLAHWNFKFIEKDGITSEKINLTNHFSLVFPQINLDLKLKNKVLTQLLFHYNLSFLKYIVSETVL